MNLLENVSLAISGLLSNKMRALLTMLGIIIGIGSVIAITSIGDSMTSSVSESLESLGVNNIAIQVSPKDPTATSYTFTKDDKITDDMIEQYQKKYGDKILGIGLMEGAGSGIVTKFHQDSKVSLEGVNAGFASGATGTQVNMIKGRFITEADTQRAKRVAVIAESLANTLFPTGQAVGQEVKVQRDGGGRETFTIVGVYEEQMNSFMMGSDSRSTSLYIPITTAYRIEDVSADGYFYFYVAVQSGMDYQAFAQESADFFNDRFYVKNDSMHCEAQSMDTMVKQMKDTMGTMSMAISVIAGISLLVGGIGVMNIMLVSVTERTREIGIRKALGAPDGAIRMQFIVESMIICIIGGILGILLGAGLGYAGGILLGAPAVPSISSIIIAVGFSMLIGVFFGYYPANKAAKLDPIESLRYE